jgi:hypothetical protein
MSITTGLIALTDLRPAAGAVLAPELDTDPAVLVDVVDSLTPPALMLLWGEPWLEPTVATVRTMGQCEWTARLEVLCVGGRVEPGAGMRMVEQLVAYTVGRMAADSYTWPLNNVAAPRIYPIGRVDYLGARVTYQVPTTI